MSQSNDPRDRPALHRSDDPDSTEGVHAAQTPHTSDGEARRRLLKLGATLLTVGSGSLLAACGGGGDASAAPATPGSPSGNTPPPAPAPAPAPEAAPAPTPISSFALAVLPDTQFYSRYATTAESSQYQTRFGNEPFSAQTGWIAENA